MVTRMIPVVEDTVGRFCIINSGPLGYSDGGMLLSKGGVRQ